MHSLDELTTVLIPTSPIPQHPDTSLIEECIGAVRFYFPEARIIIMADGVRPAIQHRAEQYREYLKRLSAKVSAMEFGNCELMVSDEFQHQARMTRRALGEVKTPLVLFVEHDAILRTEPKIDFGAIVWILDSNQANMVRLYQWEKVPWHEHEYLMRGKLEWPSHYEPNWGTWVSSRLGGDCCEFVKTVQYSQWPLMARTEYQRKVLNMIDPTRHTMIEPAIYNKIANEPWEANKIVIYAPENAHTFYHRDGRRDPVTDRKDPADW